MSDRTSLSDRMLKRAVPRPVPGFAPEPVALGDGLFALDRRLRHFGVALLPTRTTIARLADGALVVISPPPLADGATRRAIDALGRVAWIVAPSSFHYLYAGDFARHYPDARLVGAPGLGARAPGLALDAELVAPPAAWSGVLDTALLRAPRGVAEVLFFHAPSRALVLTDLAFHVTHYPRALDRLVWRLSGIPRGFGPGRTTRGLLLGDRAAAREALRRALAWPFERIVVAHGEVLEHGARAAFERAFAAWLED
ncbi:MAG: DUF4336 domain-containing protein [Myxococcota bacterium]